MNKMEISMNSLNTNTCQQCKATAEMQTISTAANLRSAGLTTEDKEALWETLNAFYKEGNPFAYQFTANDVNQDVAEIVRQMTMEFADCAKKVAPFEILSIITAIYSLANARSWFQLSLNLGVFYGPGVIPP